MHSHQNSGEPSLSFIGDLPHPDHNRCLKKIQFHKFTITFYSSPKLYGEVIGNFPSFSKYQHVAVVSERNEPILIIRTEENSFLGTTFICSISKDGAHMNMGKFVSNNTKIFQQEVVRILSKLEKSK